ncbi:hypothetical protein SAMN05216391_102134 [Lachnospiraceae bacterium KHCPX20]|nr:hypothetical protein SAMN05216391_102134 [Lachnospiraceae bacterium KHCPX20]
MKIKKRILSLALAGTMALGLMQGMSMTALAEGDTSTYTLTIPSTLTVANSGWNATDGISATGTLASGKKLTVTAASANSWALKQQDGNERVSYTMKETSDGEAKTAWEFTTLPSSATLGIDVADYSTKPAGTYQDTVTFTAKVEDAAPATITVTINQSDWGSGSFTKDGVTVSAEVIDLSGVVLAGNGTFSTTLGNFTKIVVTADQFGDNGTGWSGGTWTGTPASTVSFNGGFNHVTTIVCTIVPTN